LGVKILAEQGSPHSAKPFKTKLCPLKCLSYLASFKSYHKSFIGDEGELWGWMPAPPATKVPHPPRRAGGKEYTDSIKIVITSSFWEIWAKLPKVIIVKSLIRSTTTSGACT
jgi:hypothetical protein